MYNLFDHIDANNISEAEIEIRKYKKHNTTNFNSGIRGFLNYTPLHMAVLRNKIDMVKLFLRENADPTTRILEMNYPPNGILALYLAEDFGKSNITAILKPYTDCWQHYKNTRLLFWTIIHYKNQILYIQKHKTIINTVLLIGDYIEIKYYKELDNNEKYILKSLPTEIWILILKFCRFSELGYTY